MQTPQKLTVWLRCLLLIGLSSVWLLAESNPRQIEPYWQNSLPLAYSFRLATSQPLAPSARGRTTGRAFFGAGPWLTIKIAEPNPYLKQTVLVSIRITSERSLASVSIQVPYHPQLLTELLGEPKAKAVFQRGRHLVVTNYHYIYTPLESGDLLLPVIQIEGELTPIGRFSPQQTHTFKLQGPTDERWKVRPAVAEIAEAWLPLQNLALNGNLESGAIAKLKKGESARYTLQIKAFGTKGDYLPSLAATLQDSDFKSILSQVQHSTKLNNAGELVAYRAETFTLTPKRNGFLRIPSVGLTWWNLAQNQLEHTLLPTHTIKVKAEFLSIKEKSTTGVPTLPELALSYKLIALLVVVLLAIGWWILIGSRKISRVQWSDELYPTLRAKSTKKRKNLPQ